ncbi:hypothetical protein D3C86_1584250 [compost metagenome]
MPGRFKAICILPDFMIKIRIQNYDGFVRFRILCLRMKSHDGKQGKQNRENGTFVHILELVHLNIWLAGIKDLIQVYKDLRGNKTNEPEKTTQSLA